MRSMPVRPERTQSLGEEIANSVSHGIACAAALLASPFLILQAARQGDTALIAGAAIFAASMVLLYLASALYHALPAGSVKRLFRLIDHSAVYVLIAGTYTPFTLGVLRGPWGWSLLTLIWALALAGVLLKTVGRVSHPPLSTGLYVLMGWLIVVALEPLAAGMSVAALWWLVAGGLAYTAGVLFFVLDHRLRYGHLIWHLFVMSGTVCHFFAVYWCLV